MDINQLIRYSKDDIDSIKQFRESRPDALVILRNFFLQLELTEEEKVFIKAIPAPVIIVLSKSLTPVLLKDIPLGSPELTFYNRLKNIVTVTPLMGNVLIQANDILAVYMTQQFNALTQEPDITITLSDLTKELSVEQAEQRVINMIAFNTIVEFIENNLFGLSQIQQPVVETPEEKAKRELANSSK